MQLSSRANWGIPPAAIHPRVTGFVKTVNVDRGSRVRAGDVLATIDALNWTAQRSEAQSKLQLSGSLTGCCTGPRRGRQGSPSRSCGIEHACVVAGNDVRLAERAAASQSQVNATLRERRSRTPGAQCPARNGRLSSSHRSVRRRGDRAERNRVLWLDQRLWFLNTAVRLIESNRLSLVGSGSRGLHHRALERAPRFRFRWPPIPTALQDRWRVSLKTVDVNAGRWPSS